MPVVLSDVHKLKLNQHIHDAQNKPVWRELTYVACSRLIMLLMPLGSALTVLTMHNQSEACYDEPQCASSTQAAALQGSSMHTWWWCLHAKVVLEDDSAGYSWRLRLSPEEACKPTNHTNDACRYVRV